MPQMSTVTRPRPLAEALADASDVLRAPDVVLQPAMLGAARLTRYSFNRMFMRRAAMAGWKVDRTRFEIDGAGCGEATYRLDLGPRWGSATFVAFTRTLDEREHTDRVIANRWEISACLIDGHATPAQMARLRREIPRQEEARLDPSVLVLTRGNRSVRFFDYLVERLAAGRQPEPERVGDSGYIMRSTAFYANGKYGMRSFEGYPTGHPFAVPFRAQFAAAWLFRELAYDVVEHCARHRGGDRAAPFDDEWSRFFGLGNATGLGLVPYAFKHPQVIHTWVAIRELALAQVRAFPPDPARGGELAAWIERARHHLATGSDDDCTPFRSPQQLRELLAEIATAWSRVALEPAPFDALYRWAETTADPETVEWVVSLLVELSDLDDEWVDESHTVVDESPPIDTSTRLVRIAEQIDATWPWLDRLALDGSCADTYWWVISDNTEEPRRVRRDRLAPDGRDVAVDVALRMARFRAAIAAEDGMRTLGDFLVEFPTHHFAAARLATADARYGEPRDNSCAAAYLPLQIQRFQLAQYGMDHFKPKSSDWLRVTLNQGAPRAADLNDGTATDDWVLPPRPASAPPTAPIGPST